MIYVILPIYNVFVENDMLEKEIIDGYRLISNKQFFENYKDKIFPPMSWRRNRGLAAIRCVGYNLGMETKLAMHYLKLFCIKNALWLLPLIIFIIASIVIDVVIVLVFWHNPTILFSQIKGIFWFILAYIAGLYTDEIRKNLTKR